MANTPNIDLAKPAGTDHALVSVLNSNSDKIDTFAGTTNQAIANLGYDIGSKTVSGFQSDIETKLAALDNGKSFSFKVDLSDSVSPISSGTHTGIATRSISGRYNVLLQRSGSTACSTYAGSLTSNGWTWQELYTNGNSPTGYWILTANTAKTFNLAKNARLFLVTEDSSADRCGLMFVYTASGGGCTKVVVRDPTALTIDTSVTQKITITSPGSTRVMFHNVEGNPIGNIVTE